MVAARHAHISQSSGWNDNDRSFSGKFELSEWRTWIVSIGGAAIAAGISAVMNMVKEGR